MHLLLPQALRDKPAANTDDPNPEDVETNALLSKKLAEEAMKSHFMDPNAEEGEVGEGAEGGGGI